MTQATNTRSDSRGGIGSKNKSQDKNYKMKAEFKAMFFLFFFFLMLGTDSTELC